jgi:hypothetical protein
MKRLALLGLAVIALALLLPASSYAQATRTWISGVGDDANPCSRTAPCKTWAGAISKTAAGGEIDALDPGGFGALTITKSITLDGGGGQVASVLVSGTNGINISAASNAVVILRNLRFDGLLGNGSSPGSAGVNGIVINTAAAVVIENVDAFGFNTWGVLDQATTNNQLHILNSVFSNNGVSTTALSGGILIAPGSGGTVKAELTGVKVTDSNIGIRVDGSNTTNPTSVAIKDSVSSGAAHSGILATTTGGSVTMQVFDTQSTGNNVGVAASGTNVNVYLGNSVVTGNNTGISQTASGVVQSYKTNQINGNNTDGTPITAAPGLN